MAVALTGFTELDANLTELKGSAAKRVTRQSVAAGTRVIAKAIKRQIPARLKDVRAAIGSRVKTESGEVVGKAGAAVGMTVAKIAKRLLKQGGVGISARNIHWWILGTGPRFAKSRGAFVKGKKIKGRHYTGRMPAHPVVKAALAASGEKAQAKMEENFRRGIEREVAKMKK